MAKDEIKETIVWVGRTCVAAMVMGIYAKMSSIDDRLANHETRLTLLEYKVGESKSRHPISALWDMPVAILPDNHLEIKNED